LGRFEKFVGSECVIDIGLNEPLRLKLVEKDRLKVLAAQELNGEERYQKIFDTIVEIVKRNYPDETEEEIKALVLKKFESIFMELAVFWGWITEEQKISFLPTSPQKTRR
jgi:hypothetical protein